MLNVVFFHQHRKPHDELCVRSVRSWNAIISGYSLQGHGPEAIHCFDEMQGKGFLPDATTFTCVLHACCKTKDIDRGKHIHDEIANKGLLKGNAVLGNALVEMYVKCGELDKAEQVHDELCTRSVVSWNSLISGYTKQGQGHDALNCYERMHCEGLSPDVITYTSILQACGDTRSIEKGKEIHDLIARKRLLKKKKNIVMGNALVNMYSKCGELGKARQVLNELPTLNAISWSTVIAGYTEQGQCHEALCCYNNMKKEGISPTPSAFTCVVKACGSIGAIDDGKHIHEEIMERNLLKNDVILGSALVDMYAKCGSFTRAQEVHNELHVRNVVSWSALIASYVQHGKSHEALNCFEQMQNEGVFPNAITFTSLLKACSDIGDIDKGRQIHGEIVKRALQHKNIMLGNALVDMHARCNALFDAQQILRELCIRNAVSWSALITGYTEQGHGHKALECFRQMRDEGLTPDSVTFICTLKACASIGTIDIGMQIHADIVEMGLLERDNVLGTALVDMYAKCGLTAKAQQVFEVLPVRNLFTWSALIAGYAQQGQAHEALNRFRQMQGEGLPPDAVTFVCIMNACNHSGLLDYALTYFGNMGKEYKLRPTLEHHTCMVVVYGYAGQFEQAMSIMETMPSSDDSTVWLALLAACRKWGNLKIGRLAFEHAIERDNNCPTAYVLMADIYVGAGMQDEAQNIKGMR